MRNRYGLEVHSDRDQPREGGWGIKTARKHRIVDASSLRTVKFYRKNGSLLLQTVRFKPENGLVLPGAGRNNEVGDEQQVGRECKQL